MKPQLRIFLPEQTGKFEYRFIKDEWLLPLSDVYELIWTNQDPHIIPLVIPKRFERMLAIISKISASDNTGLLMTLNKEARILNLHVRINTYIEKHIKYCKNSSFYRPVTVAIFKDSNVTDIDSWISGFNYCFSYGGQLTKTERIECWQQIANDSIAKSKQFSTQNFFLRFFPALHRFLKRAVVSALPNLRLCGKKILLSRHKREYLYLLPYEIQYRFVRHRFAYPPHFEKYRVYLKRLHLIKRVPGISAMLRVYNEEFLLQGCVESHIHFFDEIVVVYDSTTDDRSPRIIEELKDKYPDKIKVCFYEPEVYKISSKEYRMLPITHPNSLVNYYNYNFSQTTRQIVSKLDADHIAIPDQMEKVIQRVRDPQFMEDVFYTHSGIIVYLKEDGTVFIDELLFLTGNFDHGFYQVPHTLNELFIKGLNYEFQSPLIYDYEIKNAGITYFHIKTHPRRWNWHYSPTQHKPLSWPEFVEKYRDSVMDLMGTDLTTLPDPNVYLHEKLSRLFRSIKNNM